LGGKEQGGQSSSEPSRPGAGYDPNKHPYGRMAQGAMKQAELEDDIPF
jgi:hypothetical protein